MGAINTADLDHLPWQDPILLVLHNPALSGSILHMTFPLSVVLRAMVVGGFIAVFLFVHFQHFMQLA